MMKDLYIAFTEKEITTFGGVSLLYKMLDNCHFNEALSSVGLPQQGSSRGKSPEQLIYGLFTGLEEATPHHYGQTGNRQAAQGRRQEDKASQADGTLP